MSDLLSGGSPAPEPTASVTAGAAPLVPDASPAPAPAADNSPAVVETPAAAPVEPAKVTETKHTDTPTLLDSLDEPKPVEGDKPTEGAQTVTEAVAPTYEAFTMPDGVTMADEGMTQFKTLAGKYGLAQEAAQEMLNMGLSEISRMQQNAVAEQHRAWGDVRKGWRDQVLADDQIGGSGHQTAMRAIANVRDRFVPDADRAAFKDMMSITGVGDHPAMLKFMHNVSRALNEPAAPSIVGKPAPTGGKPGGKRDSLYNHPSSKKRMGS